MGFLYIIDIIVLVKCLDKEEKDLIYSYYSRFLYIKTIILKIMTQEVLDRMLVEFQENGERTNKLRAFILDTEKFDKLDNINKDLLIAQLKAMETYVSILSIRIGLNSRVVENTEESTEELSEKIGQCLKK